MLLILKLNGKMKNFWSPNTFLGPLRLETSYFIIGIQAYIPLGTSKCLIIHLLEVCPFCIQ